MRLQQTGQHHAKSLRSDSKDDAQPLESLGCLLGVIHQRGEHGWDDAVDGAPATAAEQHGKRGSRRLQGCPISLSGYLRLVVLVSVA